MSPYQGRNFRSRDYTSSLSKPIKDRVCEVVYNRPGLTAREIAKRLGIDRREMNRFLDGEGLQRRSLIVKAWRWYPSDYVQPPLSFHDQPSKDTNGEPGRLLAVHLATSEASPRTLCGVLKGMDELGAIREIRRLDLLAIEKAFSEAEYAELSEALQIELVQRLEEIKQLEARKPPQRSGGNRLIRWLVIGVALYGGVILVLKILHVLSR